MNNAYELGTTIKNLRVKRGLTQKRLGTILNVSEATVSKYENNTAVPPFETLRTMAVTFNVSMDTLCGITHRGSVSVQGLSESQISIVENLTDTFRNRNLASQKMLSQEQCTLLGQIVVELSKV